MRAATHAMIALLNNNQFRMADLYTVTLVTGDLFHYTDYDMDLSVAGNLFVSDNLQISRSGIRTVAGIEVDTLSAELLADPTHTMLDTPVIEMAHNGGLDGATMQVERAFMPIDAPSDTSAGTLVLFSGRINVDEIDRGRISMSVVSDIELLNIQMPRNIYQPGCSHSLFDAGCGLTKASYAVFGTVASGSDVRTINCGLSNPADHFTLGTVTFLSGSNAGVSRTVKSYTTGVLAFSLPLKGIPAVGDTFNAYPGCDKQQSTCTNKFNNLIRFRGFPYIPIPETAL